MLHHHRLIVQDAAKTLDRRAVARQMFSVTFYLEQAGASPSAAAAVHRLR